MTGLVICLAVAIVLTVIFTPTRTKKADRSSRLKYNSRLPQVITVIWEGENFDFFYENNQTYKATVTGQARSLKFAKYLKSRGIREKHISFDIFYQGVSKDRSIYYVIVSDKEAQRLDKLNH